MLTAVSIKKDDYDCILLDFRMPDLNGIQLAKEVKKFKPQTPIVMMSGDLNLSAQVDNIREADIAKIFYKPFHDMAELKGTVNQLIGD